MKLKISKYRRIAEIQKAFRQQYPYLKLVFYKIPHNSGETSTKEEVLDAQRTIGEVGTCNHIAYISMSPQQKVGDFEQIFATACGLNVQVFRKSYGKWLQTWATDIWTLEEQNNRGRIMGDRRA